MRVHLSQSPRRDKPVLKLVILQAPVGDELEEQLPPAGARIGARAVVAWHGERSRVGEQSLVYELLAIAALLVRMLMLLIAKMFDEERGMPPISEICGDLLGGKECRKLARPAMQRHDIRAEHRRDRACEVGVVLGGTALARNDCCVAHFLAAAAYSVTSFTSRTTVSAGTFHCTYFCSECTSLCRRKQSMTWIISSCFGSGRSYGSAPPRYSFSSSSSRSSLNPSTK